MFGQGGAATVADDYIWEAISRDTQRNEKRFLLLYNALLRLAPEILQEEVDKLYTKSSEDE